MLNAGSTMLSIDRKATDDALRNYITMLLPYFLLRLVKTLEAPTRCLWTTSSTGVPVHEVTLIGDDIPSNVRMAHIEEGDSKLCKAILKPSIAHCMHLCTITSSRCEALIGKLMYVPGILLCLFGSSILAKNDETEALLSHVHTHCSTSMLYANVRQMMEPMPDSDIVNVVMRSKDYACVGPHNTYILPPCSFITRYAQIFVDILAIEKSTTLTTLTKHTNIAIIPVLIHYTSQDDKRALLKYCWWMISVESYNRLIGYLNSELIALVGPHLSAVKGTEMFLGRCILEKEFDSRNDTTGFPYCSVCSTNTAVIVVLPCRHQCLCINCSAVIFNINSESQRYSSGFPIPKLTSRCPVCSAIVTTCVKVFFG